MQEFYNAFYAAIAHSPAHATFCERVFGADFGQHGFADMAQLDLLIRVTGVRSSQHALDLGCGDGRIAEYLSDQTSAQITGLDYSERAIRQAQQRTAAKAERLTFRVGDINHLELPTAGYDLVFAIDTIYFSEDYAATIQILSAALRPGGQLALFYSYGREPWVPRESFPQECLPPDNTPLAVALRENNLLFRTWDLTRQDDELALRRKAVLEELKPAFAAEGNLFIYEQRIGDAEGIHQAIAEGLHARYLYLAQPAPPI